MYIGDFSIFAASVVTVLALFRVLWNLFRLLANNVGCLSAQGLG